MFLQNHHGAVGLPGVDFERAGESSASSPVRPRSGARGFFADGEEAQEGRSPPFPDHRGVGRVDGVGGANRLDRDDGVNVFGGATRVGANPVAQQTPAARSVPPVSHGLNGVDETKRGLFPSISTRGASFHTAMEHGLGQASHGWNDAYHAKQERQPKMGSVVAQSNVTKMDRRQAWIRFLALDACKDICIESMLVDGASVTDLEFCRGLMADGCTVLREGLGLGGLLLGKGDGSVGAINIHWDDVDVGGEGRIVMVDDGRRDGVSDMMVEKSAVKGPWGAKKTIAAIERCHGPENDHNSYPNEELQFGVPAVEVKVSRVVGAPFLDTVSHDASIEEGPGDYSIRAFVKGGVPCTSAIGSTGGVVSGGALCISTDQVTSVKDALYLEVYKKGEVLEACGSVMISELQRLAVRSDALGQEPAPSLLKQLIHPASFGFRKRKESGGSLIWAKLVATDGAPAGHVLLAARARPGQMGGGVLVGPRYAHGSGNDAVSIRGVETESCSGSGSGSGRAPVIPSGADESSMRAKTQGNLGKTPIQIRAHHGSLGHHDGVYHLSPPRKLMEPNNLRMGGELDDRIGGQAMDPSANALASLALNHKGKHYGNIAGGYLQVNARHVYDVLLDCALKASGCDRTGSSLELQPQWSWMTRQFASKHGIREEYATLAYLQWILENHCVQPNSMCFEVIAIKHGAMKTSSKASSLESHEVAMNTKVRQDIKELLSKTFENYFALKQTYDDDVEFVPTRGPQAATVLRSAIKLLFLVLDGDASSANQWMAVRFKRAASKRFYAILAAIEAQIIEQETGRYRARPSDNTLRTGGRKPMANAGMRGNRNSPDVIAYKKVGDLCRTVIEEIREDEGIQASLSQSNAVHDVSMVASICVHTAIEYIKGISAHLKAVLSRYPPRRPIPAALTLVQAVGHLQDFLERHEYVDAAVRLNAFDAFSGFIQHWISSSSASLRRGVQIIEETPGSGPGGLKWKDMHENKGNMVVPFAEVLLRELQREMELYRPILGIWPSYAVEVERACVDVLRLAISVASKHCGLVQYSQTKSNDSSSSKRRTAWKWTSSADLATAPDSTEKDVTDAIRQGTNVLQALLMNTLRRLLAVMPQIESTIDLWCEDRPETSLAHGEDDTDDLVQMNRSLHAKSPADRQMKPRSNSGSPEHGALWAQLVKEVRTEYYATITLTAEALSRQLSTSHVTSVQHMLRKFGLQASESSMVRKSERALDQTSPTLRIMSSVLDSRVFVALSRGLWDLTARQILQYAEDLTEGSGGTKDAWRGRQNAAVVLSCVENFFKHEISTCMGSDLQAKDLDPPQHFQRAKALVSKGSNRVDQSFDVY